MISYRDGTKLSPQQVDLRAMFSPVRLLTSRGFKVEKDGDGSDTLLPRTPWGRDDVQALYEVFRHAGRRAELCSLIEGRISSATSREVQAVIGLSGYRSDRKAFSSTFEWFVGELLIREFAALSAAYGVEVANLVRHSDNAPMGKDFDTLAVLADLGLLFLECKTGRLTANSLENTLTRASLLHCSASVVLLGAGISSSDLEDAIKNVTPPIVPRPTEYRCIETRGVSDSSVFNFYDCYLVEADEVRGALREKLNTVMRVMAAKRAYLHDAWGFDAADLSTLGYDCRTISLAASAAPAPSQLTP